MRDESAGGYLCAHESALAARLLGVSREALLTQTSPSPLARTGTSLGALFESLVTQSVRVYAQAAEATIHPFRTERGRQEVDVIARGLDHRIVAIEVKWGGVINDDDVTHLHWLRGKLGDSLADAIVVHRIDLTAADSRRTGENCAEVRPPSTAVDRIRLIMMRWSVILPSSAQTASELSRFGRSRPMLSLLASLPLGTASPDGDLVDNGGAMLGTILLCRHIRRIIPTSRNEA